MITQEAIKMIKAKKKCLENDTSGQFGCGNFQCGDCDLNYMQGNMGEQIEWLDLAIKALEEQDKHRWRDDTPEEGGYYLVTYREWSDGNYLPKFDDTYVRRLHYQNSEQFVGWNFPKCIDEKCEADEHREVIAWMELPEPYKKD